MTLPRTKRGIDYRPTIFFSFHLMVTKTFSPKKINSRLEIIDGVGFSGTAK